METRGLVTGATAPQLAEAVEALRSAQRVVVFTGAGMSAESGIPTFREAQTGLWSRFSPDELASPQGWAQDCDRVWAWYEWRRALAIRARPNPGHEAIALLTNKGKDLTVVTQNVDNLHERAGSVNVVHLHGSLFEPRCSRCGHQAEEPAQHVGDEPLERMKPPRCNRCGGAVRPGVVWFGETLPQDKLQLARSLVADCDILIAVGTSGTVQPAAGLVTAASAAGKFVLELNPVESLLSHAVAVSWRVGAAVGLPLLVASL